MERNETLGGKVIRDEDILSEIMSGDYKEQLAEMEEKFPASRFPGCYPIGALHYNINEAYNHYSSEVETDLQREVSWKFDSKLEYNYGDDKFCGPHVSYEGEKYHATFYENFNAFLWLQAIMYCNFCSLNGIKVDKKEFTYPIDAVEY